METVKIQNTRKGFTLVELSIVMVIVGMLIGGILLARSMGETAKVQRLITDLAQYGAATNTFKEAYEFYPGDSSKFTPPGNDDSVFNGPTCAVAPNATLSGSESPQFFAHLSQAEMLDKTYVPYSPTTTCGGTHNDDYLATGGITAPYIQLTGKTAEWYAVYYGKSLILSNVIGYFVLIVDPSSVIPMEIKFGPVLTNTYGTGNCRSTVFTTVSCTAPNALYGSLNLAY